MSRHRVFDQAEAHDWPAVFGELSEEPLLINVRNDWEATLLHYVAISGNADYVVQILAMGGEPNAVDRQGRSALHWMAIYGHNGDTGYDEVAETLIQNGADANLRSKTGETPMSIAEKWSRLVTDQHQPIPAASLILGDFMQVLRKHGGTS